MPPRLGKKFENLPKGLGAKVTSTLFGETKAGITELSLLFLGEKPENGISANDIFDRVCVCACIINDASTTGCQNSASSSAFFYYSGSGT